MGANPAGLALLVGRHFHPFRRSSRVDRHPSAPTGRGITPDTLIFFGRYTSSGHGIPVLYTFRPLPKIVEIFQRENRLPSGKSGPRTGERSLTGLRLPPRGKTLGESPQPKQDPNKKCERLLRLLETWTDIPEGQLTLYMAKQERLYRGTVSSQGFSLTISGTLDNS